MLQKYLDLNYNDERWRIYGEYIKIEEKKIEADNIKALLVELGVENRTPRPYSALAERDQIIRGGQSVLIELLN